jgi:hypothetical protein
MFYERCRRFVKSQLWEVRKGTLQHPILPAFVEKLVGLVEN